MTAFVLTFLGITMLAFSGGAYDVVVRHQAAVLLWWALALGVLSGVWPRSRPRAPGWVVGTALLLLAAWSALSLGWSPDHGRTGVEVARAVMHLGVVSLVACCLDRATWRSAIAGAAAAAACVVLVALARRLYPGVLGEDVIAQAFDTYRLSYPLGYWNAVGAWAGMTSALCLAWSAHARFWLWRGLALAVVPAAITVSYLTYSRASLGGTVIGLVVLFLASRNRLTLTVHALAATALGAVAVRAVREAPQIALATGSDGATNVVGILVASTLVALLLAAVTRRLGLDRLRLNAHTGRIAFAVAGTGVVVLATCALVTVGPQAWDQFKDTRATAATDPAKRLQSLNGSRYDIWSVALSDARGDLGTGSGAGTFEYTWNADATTDEFVRDAHSLYLEAAAELGIVGLLCVLLLLAGCVGAFIRALAAEPTDPVSRGALAGAAGASAAFFFGAGVDWLWESTAVATLMLVLVGAAIAAQALPASRTKWAIRVPLVSLCVAALLLQLPALVSTSEIRESQKAFGATDLPLALSHANDAIETEPWAAAPYVQRALVYERSTRLEAALADLQRAADRAPRDWRVALLTARLQARLGDVPAALTAYRKARRLRPQGRFFADPPSETKEAVRTFVR